MTSKFLGLLVALYVLCASSFVFAQVASATPAGSPALSADVIPAPDLNSLTGTIADDFASGKPVLAVSGLILVLVYLFRRFAMPKLQFGSGSLPWISMGLGLLSAVVGAVFGGMPVAAAVKVALLSGPIAGQLWSSILKLVLHKDA